METYLDLSGGLHTDFEPYNQPKSTYKYLKNAIRELSGAIVNEKGSLLIKSFTEDDRRVVGYYVLDSDTIFFSYAPSTRKSEIGILTEDSIYLVITNDPSLGFSLNTQVKAEGKKNFKGERVIYFTGKGLVMRILNLDNLPAVDFDDNTRLLLTASMPEITTSQVVDGGSIPTGVYQFGVRLLTKSTNSTTISLLTNPLSVVDEDSLSSSRVDGAPPQTESNKAISLTIDNIDIDYEFLEVIAIIYIGTANVTKVDVVGRVPIQGRNTLTFTYSTLTQIRESLDINGLIIDPLTIDSAEFIIQKDGILVLGGLTSSEFDYNFQSAANRITVQYTIKESIWQENISINNGIDTGTNYPVGEDYKNSTIAQDFKSYMRDEVYSFAVVPIFKNWSIGNAYHISSKVQSLTANTTTKELGTYTSTETYPTGRDYPIGQVKHFKMPSLIQEPHIQVRNGQTYIRILGLKADLTQFLLAIPEAIKKNIIGYIITKQKRGEENKSILTQGVASGHINYEQNRFVPLPFSGNTQMYQSNGANDLSMIAFYSPETIITKESMKSATSIKPVMQMTGTSYLVKDRRTDDNKFAYVLLDYNTSGTSTTILNSTRSLDTSLTQYISAGPELSADAAGNNLPTVPIIGTQNSIVTWRNPGYLFLKTSTGDLPLDGLNTGGKGDVYYEGRSGRTDLVYLNGIDQGSGGNQRGTTRRHLYNLVRERANQYGAIYDAKYHYVKHVMVSQLNNPIIECFNGDTFINKFAVMSSMNPGTGQEQSYDLKGLTYIWLESSINVGYRHYIAPKGTEGQPGFESGTLPYYPKVKVLHSDDNKSLGLFNYSPSLGHPTGYNKQYSFENTLRTYFPSAIDLDIVSVFPNRLVYTEQSIEGEKLDAYRILLPNNFHDIPKEKGKITNLFNLSNNIYVHTERSLWKTYFNEQVTQASSAGEIYLGTGGVFNRPATEVISVKGGYAGTTSTSGYTTPFGHFFIDTTQGKVFLFSNELKEISDQGMFTYFRDNVDNIVDTPALGIGYSSCYDYEHKRWLVTKIGQWTLSYSTQLNSWSAFHDYTPYHYISSGSKLLSLQDNSVHEMNKGVRGVYYDNLPSDLRLDIVINEAGRETKILDNIVLFTTAQNNTGLEQHYDTFSTIQVYNSTKNTGKCRLIVPRSFNDEFISLNLFECFAKLKNNEFRISVPSDLVINTEQSIFDVNNLDINRGFRPRMSGKYFVVSLSYNNLRNNKFVIHNIGKIFRQKIR